MPKKILLIESDAAFAREMTGALERKAFEVRVAADGKEGLDAAHDFGPAAIVLCVELPGMSGYSICNKLKKDEQLKGVPLIITSAEATPETFEQHKKLKGRAEDYLIKPFSGATLIERLRALTGAEGLPEEVVTLADVELEALGNLEGAVEVRDEEPPPAPRAPGRAPALPAEDEDLKLLDDAFDSIAAAPAPHDEAPPSEAPVEEEEILAAAGSLPEPEAPAAPSDIDALGDEADAALDALSAGDDEPVSGPPVLDDEPPAAAPRAASADLLRAAGIPVLGEESRRAAPIAPPFPAEIPGGEEAPAREEAGSRGEIESLRRQVEEARAAQRSAEREAKERSGDLKLQKTKLDGMSATVKRLETDLKNAREETRRALEKASAAEGELQEIRDRAEDAERAAAEKGAAAAETAGRMAALEREVEEARNELLAARGEAEGVRGDVEKRTADLRRRLQELEAATAKHEERVVKAYQKIKSDEKLREKTRKALTIALQLLDERAPVESGEKEGRTAARD